MSLTQTLPRSPADVALASLPAVGVCPDPLDPVGSTHEVHADVVGVRRETFDVTTLTLHPTSTWKGFRAGQHVQVGVESDRVPTRCSISSSDLAERLRDDRTFSITVKGHDTDPASQHLARHSGPGTVLHLSQAQGDFVLPAVLPPRLLMVSGGSGVTPLMSVLRSLVDQGYDGRITFLHYARTPEETIFGTELDELAEHPTIDLTVVHTRTGEKRLSRLQLQGLAPHFADTFTMACGPAGLVATLQQLYGDRDNLCVEQFQASGSHLP